MQPSPGQYAQQEYCQEAGKRVSINANQLLLITKIYTSGSENDSDPKNFITKYSNTGTPKPKLYTITTPYLTSSNWKMY